jgi:L-asparaginase II
MERRNPFRLIDPPPLPPNGEKPLEVCLIRGEAIESRHRVHAMVCDGKGEIVHQWGSPELRFFPRSSVKLIQATSWVSEGLDKKWGLGAEELSIACGSHHGEQSHVRIVDAWLKKLGLNEQDLECGPHAPYDSPSAQALLLAGHLPSQLHNNCSGKHSGLLTLCREKKWEIKGYSCYDHPIQQRLREIFGQFFELDMSKAPWGIDGCGIPTYSITLETLGRSMARVASPGKMKNGLGEAARTLTGAIGAQPSFMGGSGSFCSQVVAETEGRVFAKVGAEGVYGAWIPKTGLGIAMKCEDGGTRATEVAMASVLRELGHPLNFFSPLARRWTGEVVGQFFCA